MKKLAYTICIFICCISCTTQKTKTNFEVEGFTYAQLVSIEQKEGYQLLKIKNPKTQKAETSYALIPRGSKLKTPHGMQKITVPVERLAALSTSFVGMLDALQSVSVIKATTEKQYIHNEELLRNIAKNDVLISTYETGLSPDAILKAHIPLIIFSGFGQPFPNEEKLKQLDVVCMANYDWEETHPLGKAEWIKVFGALVGKNEEADTYFKQVEISYLQIKERASKIQQQKKVMCGSLAGDLWYAPGGKSFMAGIMKDAGLDYFYKTSTSSASIQLTLEQAFKDDQKCAVWINAEAISLGKLTELNPKFQHFHTVKSGRVYSYLHDSNYYWEYSQVNPHWLLEDYVQIAQGVENPKFYFYKQLK